MSPSDSSKSFLELLEESPGVENQNTPPAPEQGLQPQVEPASQPEDQGEESFEKLLAKTPPISQDTSMDIGLGGFNKTLSASNGQLATFSNPPSALEIASSQEPPPFLVKPVLPENLSFEQLLENDSDALTPASSQIVPGDAVLQVDQKEVPPEPKMGATDVINPFMRGAYSTVSSALYAYGALESGMGYVTNKGRPYDPKKTWGYQQGKAYERDVEAVFPATKAQEGLVGDVAGALGQTAAIMTTGGIMGASTGIGSLASTITTGVTLSGGNSFKKAVSENASNDQALRFAALNALAGASEAVPIAKWMDKLDKGTGGAFSRGFAGYAKELAKESAEEFTQEGFQTFMSNWFEYTGYNPSKDLMEDIAESAKVGGISGLLASAVINAMGLRLRKSAPKTAIPNAPQTSQAVTQAESDLTQEVAEGLRPFTESIQPEAEESLVSEELDLSEFLPIPIGETPANEQEPSASQEAEQTAAPSDEASGPKYGEQVLRRVAQPPGEGETASAYDVDDPELTGAGAIKPGDELNFSKPGRPATVDTGLEAQKPLAADQELPVKTGLPEKLDTTPVVEKDLFGEPVGAGEVQDFPVDMKFSKSVSYAVDLYGKDLRSKYLAANLFSDESLVFPEKLTYNEFAKDIYASLQNANLPFPGPENAKDQKDFILEVRRQILAVTFSKQTKGVQEAKGSDDDKANQPQVVVEVDVPSSFAEALQSLNASFVRAKENKPEPIKKVPRSLKNGSRVSGEIRFSEESPDYVTALNELPESPNETENLASAEVFFRRNAANLKKSRPNLTVDASRLANAARMKYWRQLRRKYDIRKNKTEGISEQEAQEIFEAQDVQTISKSRIFRSVVEDYSEKLGRRMGGNIGLETADSLQRALGPDDGSETLEDVTPEQRTNLDETEVRQDLLKNARNAFFASVRSEGTSAYLLGAALNYSIKSKKDPAEFAKNTTELSKIADVFSQQGVKTSTGELARALPGLYESFKKFVSEKRDADYANFQKTGQLPDVVPGVEKNFRVLNSKKAGAALTPYDKQMQALARSQLNTLEDADFLTPVEAANVRDKLDMSPRSSAAIRAIEELRSILSSKQPGVGLVEPTLNLVSSANPSNVPAVTPPNFKLLGHQREASDQLFFAYKSGRRGMLLADDAGLGKTRSALSAARIIADDRAKARNEPYGKVVVITESNELIDAAKGGLKNQLASANIPRNRVQFYTYDAYSKGLIKGIESADVIVFDEAQNLKNTATNRTRMSKTATATKIFVTATPTDRLSGIMYFLPDILGKAEATVRTMLDSSLNKTETLFNALESAATVGAYIRRIPEGPRPEARILELEAGPEVLDELGKIANYYGSQIQSLFDPAEPSSAATRERSLALESMAKYKAEAWSEIKKAPYIFERAMEDIAAGKQVIVFGEFVNSTAFPELGLRNTESMLATLNEMFTRAGLSPAVLYGEGGNQMTSDINDFQAGTKKVLLATPTKGGTGLSLDDQLGTAPRVVYIATPNEAGDKHEQMLHRAGYRVSSKSIPEIYELIATDIVTDGSRLKTRNSKQATLNASQGLLGDSDNLQTPLPFQDARRIDRNSIGEIPQDSRPLLNDDLQTSLSRRAGVVRNGQRVDERFSQLPAHRQQVIDDFTKALSKLGFKNVKIIFGDVQGNMSVWVRREDNDNNTIYVNPEILQNNRDRVVRRNRGRIDNSGDFYLAALASEEMMHNALFSAVRNLAVTLHQNRISRKEITAQEAYVETMEFMLSKASEEISPEARTMLRTRYGRELSETNLTLEYLRFVHQKARLGYVTEDFLSEASSQELAALLKGVPKDGYLVAWFKLIRQALFEMLRGLGITIQETPFIGSLVDATDNLLFQVESNGKTKSTDKASIEQLLNLVSPETAGRVQLSDAPQKVTSNAQSKNELASAIKRNKKLKNKPKGSVYEFGDTQVVRDAFNRGHEFVYAWVDRSMVQASHLGSAKLWASNPNYTGTNQRNYSYSDDEKGKVLRIEGAAFNAAQIANDGAGAANQGLPILMFDKNVGMWMVVAGNGREQVLGKVLKDSNKKELLLELASKLTSEKGGVVPDNIESSNLFLYRVLREQVDTGADEGRERLNQLIKETNSEGGSELTHLSKAEQDYENIVKSATGSRGLLQAALNVSSISRENAQTLLSILADQQVLNREERNALLNRSAGSMPVEYLQYLILRNFLTPLDRHNTPGEIPGRAMASEMMDQGRQKEVFLLLAQASAAAQSLSEISGKKYKGFLSRIANEMLKKIATREDPLDALYTLKVEERDIFDMLEATESKAFPEVAADPEFKTFIDFIFNTLKGTTRIKNGITEYTVQSKKLFRVILDELARNLSESARQGNTGLLGGSPLQQAIESVNFRLRSNEIDPSEFTGTGDFEVDSMEEAEKLAATIRVERAQKRLNRDANVFEDPYTLDGDTLEKINEEPSSYAESYEDMDIDQYSAVDEADQDNPEYGRAIENLKIKRGFLGRNADINAEQIEMGLENISISETFEGENYQEPEKLGYKSREEYNQLLAALDRAGMRNYFKFKKILNTIANDEEWLARVIDLAGEEGELRKFFAQAKDLMEPAFTSDALADPVIERLFGPIRRVVTLEKTSASLQKAEDEALRRLVEAQRHTQEIQKFLRAIGDEKKTKEALEIADKAQAAFERLMETGVAIQDMSSTDATWDIAKKKWIDKQEAREKPLRPLDLEYRAKLKKTTEMLEKRATIAGAMTPDRLGRINNYRAILFNLRAELSSLEGKIRELDVDIFQLVGEKTSTSKQRLSVAANKKLGYVENRRDVIKELASTEETFSRMVRTEHMLKIKVDDSAAPRKLSVDEQKNLPTEIVDELRRRGAIPTFTDAQPLYEKTISWEFPENFITIGNKEPVTISAQVVFLPSAEAVKRKGKWNLPTNYKGVGIITQFNTTGNISGNYKVPIFTDGKRAGELVAELAASAYYEKSNSIGITRNQYTAYPSILLLPSVVPNLSVTKRLTPMPSATNILKFPSSGMRPKQSALVKEEPQVNERGESMWEFQLTPETPEFSDKKLNLTTRSSRGRKIYVRARTAEEAVAKSVLKLGEVGDIYYKGKWYGKNIAQRTRKLTAEEQSSKDEETGISFSQAEVRKAIRNRRMDYLNEAMARGRQMDSAFDFVAKREVEAYLSAMFEKGVSIEDEYVTKLSIIFGFVYFDGPTLNRKALEKIRLRALERMTPKTMSLVKRSSKINATGPIRDVEGNSLFAGKRTTESVAIEEQEFTVPGETLRTSSEVLQQIAMANGVSAQDLAKANALTLGKLIVGQQLLIPGTTKSVEVPNFKLSAPKMTALEIATKYGITREELLEYNGLTVSTKNDKGEEVKVPDLNYRPKAGDILKIPGSKSDNNLRELIRRIVAKKEHTTYPQMVYKDRAPQGVRLKSKAGDIVGAGSLITENGEQLEYEEVQDDVYDKAEVENAVSILNPEAVQETVDYLVAKAFARGGSNAEVTVTVDSEKNKVTIADSGKALTKDQALNLVFDSFYRDGKAPTPLAATLASADVVLLTFKDGNGYAISTKPELLKAEDKRPGIFTLKNVVDSLGKKISGNIITIGLREVVERGGVLQPMQYFLPNQTLMASLGRKADQTLIYKEHSGTTQNTIDLSKGPIGSKYINHQNLPGLAAMESRKASPTEKVTRKFHLVGQGAKNLHTSAKSRGKAIGNFAAQMVRNKITYRGKLYTNIGLLRLELDKGLGSGSIGVTASEIDDLVGAGTPFAGEERERQAQARRSSQRRDGRLETQGFAGQLASDKDLSPELNSATALRDFRYAVRTQPLRVEDMASLVERLGGPEIVADVLINPDIETDDQTLQDIRNLTTAHFDNVVILNSLLIRQLERLARLNPERANEIIPKQFALAKKQADLGTSLAQGLRAFGAYARIGASGWLWFAKNTKQVARLQQVGLFGTEIEEAARAAKDSVNEGLNQALDNPATEKIGKLIETAINNATWAKLLVGAKRISEMSEAWQRATTSTLSLVLDDQLKTAKEMIALLKGAEQTPDTKARMAENIAEATAVLLQKGTPSIAAASKDLGVSEDDVLNSLEEAQDINDQMKEKTLNEMEAFAWGREFGDTPINQDPETTGAGELKPSQEISFANRTIIENVLNGFIQNIENALAEQGKEKSLPEETAISVIRRIMRERIQFGNEKLVLTRSKLSQEQRALLSSRRFRDAMRNWPSLTQAVNIVYQQLKGTVDDSSYTRIVEAMQLAMDQPFTRADVKAFMTLPSFNFKDFVFNRRYRLTENRAQVLSELTDALPDGGKGIPEELLNRVFDKIAKEHENISNKEYEKSLQMMFGKKQTKIVQALRDKVGPIVKAALAGNLDEGTIYGYIAKKLKLSNEDWLPSEATSREITKLAEEIVNDRNGPESRRAATRTLDLLDLIKKDSGVSLTEAFIGQFYTNILQGVKTVTVNVLSPVGSVLNLASVLGVRGVREGNLNSLRTAMRAMPRALNNALTEAVDVLATGDTAGRMLAADKSISTRKVGRSLPELLADGGVKINTNSNLGKLFGELAQMWFGWNKRGVWPKIPIPRSVWDAAFKYVRKGAAKAGGGTVRAPEYPEKTPVIQVSPTGIGVLVSRLYNALDLSSTTFFSEVMAALAAKDAVNEMQLHNDPDSIVSPDVLLSKDLGSLLRLGRAIAGRGERLPEQFEGPQIVQDLRAKALEEMGEGLKPGTLDFRQQLYLSVRRNRGFSNEYWNRVWRTGSASEKAQIARFVGEINDDAFFLGSVMAYTNPPLGVLGKLAKTLEAYSNDHLIVKLVQPFYGIVTSVYQTWLNWVGTGLIKSRSGTITVFGKGKTAKPSDMAAMELGSGVAGLGLLLAGLGVVLSRLAGDEPDEEKFLDFSGRGPTDPGFKQSLIDSKKWQPDSIKIGNVWFKNPNWLPTYLIFKSLGYMSDYIKYEKPTSAQSGEVAMQMTMAGLKSIGAGVLDVPFLSGVKTLSDLSNLESTTWDRKVVTFLMKTGGSLAFGNLFNEADRKIFPEKTDRQGNPFTLTGLVAMGLGNAPFLRNFNKPMTNVLGEPVLSDGSNLPENGLDRAKQAFFNYGDIILRYRNNPDPLWVELSGKRAWVTLPDRMVRVGGIVLNEEQRDDWVMERARVLRETLRNPSYVKDLPNRSSGDVQSQIMRLTSRANRSADGLVLNKYSLFDEAFGRKQKVKELGSRSVE